MAQMTKKGIVLSVILIILLLLIIINIILQNNKPVKKPSISDDDYSKVEVDAKDRFELYITDETGFDLDALRADKLPIILQCGSLEDEVCKSMMSDLETLNYAMRGRAFVKFLDTDKYLHLLEEDNFEYNGETIQILFNSDGTPYISTESGAFGYKMVKNENGEHLYTIHRGDLTLSDMRLLLGSLGLK